jgi:adenylate cyclase
MPKEPVEIERKFLLAEDPPGLINARQHVIRQGYLSIGSTREIRLRLKDRECFLTVKDGSGLERGETEISMDRSQFDLLWPLTDGCRIEKVRHVLPWNGFAIEVDIYEGALAPLRVAEVEFANRAQSEKFVKPSFLGLEVTGQTKYSNACLASLGLPSTSGGQIGCVPLVFREKELHVVLVRSSSGQRWIVPKGQNEDSMTSPEVALMEAAEEGGVIGTIDQSSHSACILTDGRELKLYALRVATLLKRWPEDSIRKRIVLPWAEAVASIDDKELAACVEEMARRFLGQI